MKELILHENCCNGFLFLCNILLQKPFWLLYKQTLSVAFALNYLEFAGPTFS